MSKTAEALLQEFQKLRPAEQEGLLQRLSRAFKPQPAQPERPFATVKLPGGRITSQQVADAMG